MTRNFVIVGGGQAAGCAAAALRQASYDGRLTIVGDEPHLPYERPPLSKEFLKGDYDPARAAVNPEAFYRDKAVEVMQGTRAIRIDGAARLIETDGGGRLPFDRLLIATGCRARQFPGAPVADGAVVYLRNIADAERIVARLAPGRHLLLVGGGFIGLEVAAAARSRRCAATVLEAGPALLARVMPPAAAEYLEALHRSRGVEIATGACIESVDDRGDSAVARCTDGRVFEADLVVVGIGAVPNQELAAEAGLDCLDGVLVDRQARTSAPAIFAAGDVTCHPSAFHARPLRLETWDNARRQAEVAARNMLGGAETYDEIPWMWTDQYDCNVQMLGLPEPGGETLLRGTPGDGPFAVLSCRNGAIRSAVLFDLGRERRPLTRLMRSGRRLSHEVLGDPTVPLRTLAAEAEA